MLDETYSRLTALLLKHEGMRLYPYKDTRGILTIGCGRNLDSVGLSQDEAMLLLSNDVKRVARQTVAAFPWFSSLDFVRQDCVMSMVFNLGLTEFQNFKKMIAALTAQNYDQASAEMLASQWADQVGHRACELAEMMKTGRYPTIP